MKNILSNEMSESLTLSNFAGISSHFIKSVSELQKSEIFLEHVSESVVWGKTDGFL